MVNRVLSPYIGYDFYYNKSVLDRPYLGMQVFIRGEMGLLMLQILIISLLAGWFTAVRFGTADILRRERRRDLTEHLTAVGRFYSQTTHWSRLGQMERNFFINQLRIHLPRGGEEKQTLKKLLRGKVNESVIDQAFQNCETQTDLKITTDCRQTILLAVRKERGKHGS
jgi:hypothetical protein